MFNEAAVVKLVGMLARNEIDFYKVGQDLAAQYPETFIAVVTGIPLEQPKYIGPTASQDKFLKVIDEMNLDRPVGAIKEYRIETGATLKEAKDVIFTVMGKNYGSDAMAVMSGMSPSAKDDVRFLQENLKK